MLKRMKKHCSLHHKKNKIETKKDANHNGEASHGKKYDANFNIIDDTIDENERCDGTHYLGVLVDKEIKTKSRPTTLRRASATIVPASTTTDFLTSAMRAKSASNPNLDISIHQPPKKNKAISFLGSRLFKKSKTSAKNSQSHVNLRKASAPEIQKTKLFSKSVGNLLDRRHSTPAWIHDSPVKEETKDSSETSSRSSRSSRSSAASLETLRENRRSVISKLDDYIKHLKKSIDEESIANAPNRLCCAELLRTVYLRRERQCHFESLRHQNDSQHNNNCKRRRPTRHCSASLSANSSYQDFQSRFSAPHKNSKSLQDFSGASFYIESSDDAKLSWSRDVIPEVEGSITCNNESNNEDGDNDNNNDNDGKACVGLSSVYCDERAENRARDYDGDCSSDDEDGPITDNNWQGEVSGLPIHRCGTDDDDADDDEFFREKVSRPSTLSCPQPLGAKHRRKSMPIFPQALDIDIY